MYVEIGSLQLENFQLILDLTTVRPMKKYLYVEVIQNYFKPNGNFLHSWRTILL